MSEALIPDAVILPPATKGRRGTHPNSLAALRPAQPGDVRNPTGTNRQTRARQAARDTIDKRLNQAAGQIATALIDLCTGRVSPRNGGAQPNLAAIQYALGRLYPTFEQGATPSGGMRFSITWEGPPEAFAPLQEGERDAG